jgi:K+-transporting ATPase KdpF subunit
MDILHLSFFHVLALIATVAVFAYLVAVLFFPERFS